VLKEFEAPSIELASATCEIVGRPPVRVEHVTAPGDAPHT